MRSMDTLGSYIRERREALNLTQGELAEEAGTSRAYMSQIESGKVGLPNAALRRGIAAALGVRHIDLLVASGEISPDEVPGPTQLAPNLNDPVERLCDLMRRVDLDVNQRQEALETTLQMFLSQDRRAGRIVEMVDHEPYATG
jgi:transcriptional regulator with XRE-family HTH domain